MQNTISHPGFNIFHSALSTASRCDCTEHILYSTLFNRLGFRRLSFRVPCSTWVWVFLEPVFHLATLARYKFKEPVFNSSSDGNALQFGWVKHEEPENYFCRTRSKHASNRCLKTLLGCLTSRACS